MNILPLVFTLLLTVGLPTQQELKFSIQAKTSIVSKNPVSVDLSSTSLEINNKSFQLYRVNNENIIPIPCQITQGQYPQLHFILDIPTKAGDLHEYILKEAPAVDDVPKITFQKNDGTLQMVMNQQPILNYQFHEMLPPDSIDSIYRRSGFIHPLWSPQGEVLTRIQPPDHYHHYGIWGPWTKTHIKGREVDFWNLIKGEGTVKFSTFLSEIEGRIFSGFSVLQEHIDFGSQDGEQVALNEKLEISAWDIGEKKWMIDYTTTINSPLDSGILFDAYRYGGGIGMRATEKWHKDNCTVLTSDGHYRATADGTKARWCIIEGESATGRSGILFMGHPNNRAFPEPMRVWPTDANQGRGDMFFEFCPIRLDDWLIKSRTDYSLKYRMIVFDGNMSPSEAELYWQAFANPPSIAIQPN